MFRHVRETGCGGEVIWRAERYLVLYGYIGTTLHGSQRNSVQDEERCPTAEGVLLAAVEAAGLRHPGASSCRAEVHSRSSRTDQGVHALANAVHLRVTTKFAASSVVPADIDEHSWLEVVRRELPAALFVTHRFLLPDASFDARRACQKREYRYHIPYRALWRPEELESETQEAEASQQRFGSEAAAAQSVWVCGLPDECSVDVLRAFADDLLASTTPTEQILLSESPGAATIGMADASGARALCAALDGAVGFPGAEGALLALPAQEAARRKKVHIRLRMALKRLTGTQSFHNFSPRVADADDPRSICSVYRCRSAMTSGYHEWLDGSAFAVLTVTGRSFLYRQILGMMGLVIAVVSGAVPEDYIDFALGETVGVEVPLAVAGNLVLAECVFRDGAFAPAADGCGARRQNLSRLSELDVALRQNLLAEMSGKTSQIAFDEFSAELSNSIAPRMRAAFEKASPQLSFQPAE